MSFDFLRSRYLKQPREVSIETFALCNARCYFCPYPTLERKGVKLGLDVIFDLIDQMAVFKEPFFVSPFKVNEPLLDTRLELICKQIMHQCPAAVLRIFTNGSPLTPRHLDWIARLARVEHLWISLNSTDPKEYETVMGLPFEKTAERLDELHRQVEAQEFPHPVVLSRVTAVTFSDDYDGHTADWIFIQSCQQRWPKFAAMLLKRDGWLGSVDPSSKTVPQQPCARWFEMSITSEGKAVLCCMTDGADEKYFLGDVKKQSLMDIYNQPYLSARRAHALNRDGIDPCARCTY